MVWGLGFGVWHVSADGVSGLGLGFRTFGAFSGEGCKCTQPWRDTVYGYVLSLRGIRRDPGKGTLHLIPINNSRYLT